MPWGYAIVAVGALASAYVGSEGAEDAAHAANEGMGEGISEERYQFNSLKKLLAPYTEAGNESLFAQRALLGLAGPEEEAKAIAALENSGEFNALARLGEQGMLQNASATGGLRGGNTQDALAQFRPQLLSDMIQRRFGNLAGITSLGQNSAAMTGNAGMQMGSNIAGMYSDMGTNAAMTRIAQSQNTANTIGTLAGLAGSYFTNNQQGANTGTGGSF